jgi:hypothetical protein
MITLKYLIFGMLLVVSFLPSPVIASCLVFNDTPVKIRISHLPYDESSRDIEPRDHGQIAEGEFRASENFINSLYIKTTGTCKTGEILLIGAQDKQLSIRKLPRWFSVKLDENSAKLKITAKEGATVTVGGTSQTANTSGIVTVNLNTRQLALEADLRAGTDLLHTGNIPFRIYVSLPEGEPFDVPMIVRSMATAEELVSDIARAASGPLTWAKPPAKSFPHPTILRICGNSGCPFPKFVPVNGLYRLMDTQYVAFRRSEYEVIEECKYFGAVAIRKMGRIILTVHEAVSGRQIATQIFKDKPPRACRNPEIFPQGRHEMTLYGESVDDSVINAWLLKQ